ncbi:alanyl-tRNA synthetase [candidate division MSBL1 archaeon SCGC-AAA382C18]|uniref:Alanine--tRNA ligase n=1 Tax=candidate division MSBL1 archaeon SCGC-AAA382C18 TaxID=1698281 RepID=A0A133VL49_9EURY|nr:alanyl-tRNA synthetase [candidate division MSBL1 archaeon SCGC-AAA382C18]
MVNQLASDNPYVFDFESEVTQIDGREVVLDHTYFYAESGGQPSDKGKINGINIEDVLKRGKKAIHLLEEKPEFKVGDKVSGKIDESFRTYNMRAHTASHIIYGAGKKILEAPQYGGFNIGKSKIRIDFETNKDLDEDNFVKFEQLANQAVWESKTISQKQISKKEAHNRDDIAINITVEDDVISGKNKVRIIEIEGWDTAACGGTHVRNTNEIGPITVLNQSNPGSGLLRIEFSIGPTGIKNRTNGKKEGLKAAKIMNTGIADLPSRAKNLVSEVKSLEEKVSNLNERFLEKRVIEICEKSEKVNNQDWAIGTIKEVDPNDLNRHVKKLVGDMADVIIVIGKKDTPFVVVGTSGEPKANNIVENITEEFGGGGGGTSNFAQGGGITAEPNKIKKYLKKEY